MEQLMDQAGAALVILIELGFICLCAGIGLKLSEIVWPHLQPVLKKHEPAIRQRVHELAKAINW